MLPLEICVQRKSVFGLTTKNNTIVAFALDKLNSAVSPKDLMNIRIGLHGKIKFEERNEIFSWDMKRYNFD